MIEDKIFVMVAIDEGNSFSTKCTTKEFDELTARDGVKQAPHMAKRQWVQIENLEVLRLQDSKLRVNRSRALVVAKLPKKLQVIEAAF